MLQLSSTPLNSYGPFGDADASKVDFQKLRKSFINLQLKENEQESYIDTDPSVRIIVGKRGAGKTLYLRSIQDYCRNTLDGSVYATDIDCDPPETELIIKVTAWFNNDNDADEGWRKIWKIVIFRALSNHILTHPDLKKYISTKKQKSFQLKYANIIPKYDSPIPILTQLSDFLYKFNSLKDLNNFIYREEWSDLEYEMGKILKDLPPLYFFLDQLDDNFASGPYQWLKCQYGLFNTIFRFIRHQAFGGRLHILVCIREIVYAYILQSFHGNKYLSEAKIKVLKWDFNLAKHFLEKKVQSLDPSYFEFGTETTLTNFFGQHDIFLKRNDGYVENISDYILRHTMLMPRDIINVGNIYYEKKRNNNSSVLNEKILRDSVRDVATSIAHEHLGIASIYITTKWIYNGAVENGDASMYTDPIMKNAVIECLKKIILKIGKDRFPKSYIIEITANLKKYGLSTEDHPFNALYLSGLLGYLAIDSEGNKKEIFFSESRNSQYNLPLQWKEYVFHTSLIDYLGIKPIGKPIYA